MSTSGAKAGSSSAADLAERHPQRSETLDANEPFQVGGRVVAVSADRPYRRRDEPERVVVPQHPGAHAGTLRHLSDQHGAPGIGPRPRIAARFASSSAAGKSLSGS